MKLTWHPKHCPLKAKPRQGKLSTTYFALTKSTSRKAVSKKAGNSSVAHHVSVVNHWSSSLEISSGCWAARYVQKAALPQHLDYRPTAHLHSLTECLGPHRKQGPDSTPQTIVGAYRAHSTNRINRPKLWSDDAIKMKQYIWFQAT